MSYVCGVLLSVQHSSISRPHSLLCAFCSVSHYEAAKAVSLPAIVHFDPSSHCSKPLPQLGHTPTCSCLSVVKVALSMDSDASTQLKAAVAVEILDYIIQRNWGPQVRQLSVWTHHLVTLTPLQSHKLLPYQQKLMELKGW